VTRSNIWPSFTGWIWRWREFGKSQIYTFTTTVWAILSCQACFSSCPKTSV